MFLSEDWERLGTDLAGGLSGVGLNLLHLSGTAQDDEPELYAAGLRCAELVAERLPEEAVGELSGGRDPFAGLMRGGAGRALLLMRAADETGDGSYLDAAERAIEADLRRCVIRENGSMEVNEGWRTMPYLETGSVGIGVAVEEFLRRRDHGPFTEAAERIAAAAAAPMYILPGMFTGRAGILLYLAGRIADPLRDPVVRHQVRGLSWHALPYGEGMAFPGTGLLRLSMDLATGGAGILLALGSVLHTDPAGLPLLPPPREAVRREPTPSASAVRLYPLRIKKGDTHGTSGPPGHGEQGRDVHRRQQR
ncbi:hypothetical protein GCM10029992_58080 [Glycomyces albus]